MIRCRRDDRAGLPEPSERRRIGTSGRAASAAQIASLERGAELVRKRGAGLCLATGCEAEVGHERYELYGGSRRSSERIDYCGDHDQRPDYRGDLDSIRGVLVPAAYAWRCGQSQQSWTVTGVSWSEELPRVARVATEAGASRTVMPPASPGSVVKLLRSSDGDLAEAVSRSIESGLFTEAA
jgi:hypothetical protein